MKKYLTRILTAVLLLSLLAGCVTTSDIANRDQAAAEASGMSIHKTGVATYKDMRT